MKAVKDGFGFTFLQKVMFHFSFVYESVHHEKTFPPVHRPSSDKDHRAESLHHSPVNWFRCLVDLSSGFY